MVVDSFVVWGIGCLATIVLAIVAYRLVARATRPQWRHPWLAAVGVVVVAFGIIVVVDGAFAAPRHLEDLHTQVGLPATYTSESSGFVLHRDGRATLTEVVLAAAVVRNEAGRLCLSGESVSTSGDGRWSMGGDGAVHIDADGKVGQLFPDDALFLADGWGKGFLLTSCDVPHATVYWAARAE